MVYNRVIQRILRLQRTFVDESIFASPPQQHKSFSGYQRQCRAINVAGFLDQDTLLSLARFFSKDSFNQFFKPSHKNGPKIFNAVIPAVYI
jgi:hypothetical protein